MRSRKSTSALVVGFLLAASPYATAQTTEETETAYVEAGQGVVVAFLPPYLRTARDQEALAATAHVRSAIAKTSSCLRERSVSYDVVFADRIVIRWPGGHEAFQVGQVVPLPGALLFRPGLNARILFAGGGPEALGRMLPNAASEYFGKKCVGG